MAAAFCVASGVPVPRALACPSCRLALEVRARVLAESFWANLAAAALPLAIVCALAAALHRIGRPSSSDGGGP
jgi:hypothetical protein